MTEVRRMNSQAKLHITIITLFPEVFTYLHESILKRAQEEGLLSIDYVNPREFTTDKHRTVDDYPFGGGSGMVIKPEPIFASVEHVRNNMNNQGKLVITSPQGEIFDQEMAEELAQENELVILCGHYEGFDERIYTLADREISIGDYVLTGGELPAMVIVDAVSRMIPGVINVDSAELDSFQESLLDYPHYTRPREFRGMEAPEVLLTGHHDNIRKWRRKESLKRTLQRRPDLMEKTELNDEDRKLLKEIRQETAEE
jgi:tRNA (guanine37-N1)-methyltransferase